MAKITVIQKSDDFTGKPFESGDTIEYTFEGKAYEIDLNTKNAAQFRKTMSRYVAASREVKASAPSGRGRKAHGGAKSRVKEVREWAASHGLDVKTRGRIPAEIMQAYKEANA